MDEKKPMDKALDTFVKSLQEENKKEREKKEEETNNSNTDINDIEDLIGFIKTVIESASQSNSIEVKYDKDVSSISVYGKDIGMMIGKEGRNITALEHIVNMIGKRKKIITRNIVLDIKDYRKNNLDNVKKLAHKMAKKAVQEGRKIALRPMPSYERKVIHKSLSSIKNVRTASKDEEPNRRVIIYPVLGEQP